MKKAFHIVVKGRVQGVGYRWFTRQVAQQLGIAGFVRNLPNGDVEVVAVGEEEALESFIAQLKKGPGFAYVSDMVIDPIPLDEAPYHSFEVTF